MGRISSVCEAMAAWMLVSFDIVCACSFATWALSCLLLFQFGDNVCFDDDGVGVLRLQFIDSIVAGARDTHKRVSVFRAMRPFGIEGVFKLFVLLWIPKSRVMRCGAVCGRGSVELRSNSPYHRRS
jgi:hypothetical protein